MRKLLSYICSLCAACTFAAGLEKGGTAFDFSAYSAERFKAAVPGADNLIANADGRSKEGKFDPLRWRGSYSFIHTADIPDNDPVRAKVKQMVRWSINDGVFTVVKPAELKKILTPKAQKSTSGGWYKSVNMPHDKGGVCRVDFEYRTQIDGAGAVSLIVSGYDRVSGKWAGAKRFFFKVHRVVPSGSWSTYTKEIEIPRGCKSIQLVFRMDGIGKMEFRNPSAVMLKEKADRPKLDLKLAPMGFLDKTFVLAKDVPVIMSFMWKRNGTPAEAALENPVLAVRLPKEISYHGSAFLKFLNQKETPAGIEYRISLKLVKNRPARNESYDSYLRLPLLLVTGAAPGRLADGVAWVEDKGKKVSNEEKFALKIIPAFKGEQPRMFESGFHIGGREIEHSGKSIAVCAEMFKASGASWIIAGHRPSFAAWRKAGLRIITPELFFIANGYRVGMPGNRPEGDKYRFTGDAYKAQLDMAVCPSAVYEKRPHFMNSTVPYIKEEIEGADGLWANWEPYMFTGRGCFCDICCRKFARFAGVPEAEMKKAWPAELAPGRKYHEQAVRFRSLEHAKLVNTINEVVTSVTGGKKSVGFVPGIQVDDMSSTWREHKFDAENHPIDYAGNFKWIDPWGPYSHWDAAVIPYIYSKIFSLRIFTKAREVRFAVNKDYPLPNRPKLLAFPHGHQGVSRLTHPESLKLDLLTYFFNGWEAATLYYFPKGYDARWWKALAEANTLIAAYEDYVFKGKRVDEKITLKPLQPYAADTVIADHLLGRYAKYSMLQHTAFEKGKAVIAAVFNFWYHGEAFFNCKVNGLEPHTRYTVKCSGKRFVNSKGESFTGKELASGVVLHAGAVRCAVYEIAPEKNSDKVLPALNPAAVEGFRKEALPALLKAKAVDDEYEKRNSFKESELKDISNGGIECTADEKKGVLHFKSGNISAEFNAVSSTVTRWEKAGAKLIHGNKISGGGTPAFWTPLCRFLNSGFAVTGQKKIPGGIEITCERRIDARNSHALEGLYIIGKIRFTDKLQKISSETTLVNKSDKALSFGFRYNVQIALPGQAEGSTKIFVNGKGKEFKRDFLRRIYVAGKDEEFENTVRKIFEVTLPASTMDRSSVCFADFRHRIKLTFAPLKLLAGAASWDGGGQVAPTFEPCFKKVKLSPKETVKYTCELLLEK